MASWKQADVYTVIIVWITFVGAFIFKKALIVPEAELWKEFVRMYQLRLSCTNEGMTR